jgi:hypothetical protein
MWQMLLLHKLNPILELLIYKQKAQNNFFFFLVYLDAALLSRISPFQKGQCVSKSEMLTRAGISRFIFLVSLYLADTHRVS